MPRTEAEFPTATESLCIELYRRYWYVFSFHVTCCLDFTWQLSSLMGPHNSRSLYGHTEDMALVQVRSTFLTSACAATSPMPLVVWERATCIAQWWFCVLCGDSKVEFWVFSSQCVVKIKTNKPFYVEALTCIYPPIFPSITCWHYSVHSYQLQYRKPPNISPNTWLFRKRAYFGTFF